jgi:hypothetical protein
VWPFTYLSNSFYCSNDHTLIRTNNFDNMYSNANNNNGVFTKVGTSPMRSYSHPLARRGGAARNSFAIYM